MRAVIFFIYFSLTPLFATVLIGSDSEQLTAQLPQIIIFSIFVGVFLSLFINSNFLYLSTKESDYLFYSGYIFFFFLWMIGSHGYLGYLFESVSIINTIKVFSFHMGALSLLLFTLRFLNIQKIYPKFFNISSLIISVSILFFITMSLGLENESFGAMLILCFISLYLGILSYIHKYVHAKYYLFAVGGYVLGLSIEILAMNEVVPQTLYTTEAHLIGFIWEMIFLLLALGYKIRLLQNERNEAISKTQIQEKMLFLQSRQASVGELVGNIAHQWREPLGEIGAIHTHLEATLLLKGSVSNEKLSNLISESYKIIRHLSDTIDVFYRFFKNKKSDKEEFDICEAINNIQQMVHYSLTIENITLVYKCEGEIIVFGNRNEFANVLLNLILNAKDVLIERNIQNPMIRIEVSKNDEKIIITIEDNGTGIKQEPIDKIFKSGVSSKEQGIGLGLFIVRTIVEQRMGGDITVKNSENGALFTIVIPQKPNECKVENTLSSYTMEEDTLERISKLEKKVAQQEETEKTLQKWADIFQHAQWGISIHVGTSNSFDLTNSAFNALYGYTSSDLKNITLPDLFEPESLPILFEAQKEAFEKGCFVFEAIHKRKNGSTFPVSIELIVVKNDNGEILYHIVNIWDLTEKKDAQERLKLKKFAIDNIQEAVYLIDKNAMFHYVNEEACKALGYTKEELLTIGVVAIDSGLTDDFWNKHWENIKLNKIDLVIRYHKRKDNTIFPVEVSANYFEYNGIGYNLAIARDITERIRLEEQKDNERTRLFFERQLVGMAITSPKKGWLQTNEKLQDMLGYTHEELSKLTWVELTYPEDLASDLEQFERLLKAEIEDYMLEKRFIRKDGTIVYTNLAVSCVRNDDYSVNYVLALLEDITEQKKLGAILEKERKFLTDAQRVSHTGSWYLDLENDLLSWSDETYRIFEFDKENIENLHKSFYECVHPDDREMVNAPYLESLKTGIPYEIEHRIVMNDGRIKYVIEKCEHIYDNDGKPLYSIGTVQDITERKEMENAIRALNETLENRVEERTTELQKALDFNAGVINAIPDLMFEIDKEGRYLNVWAKNEVLLAAQKELLLGNKISDILSHEASTISMEAIEEADENGLSFGKTIKIDLPSGEHWFELSSSKKADGNFIFISRDITERKGFEEKLKLLEIAINNASDAVYIVDNDRYIKYVSDTACRMLGYTIDEFLNMKIEEIDPYMSVEEIDDVKVQLDFKETTIFQTKHRAKNGNIFDVEITVTRFVFNETDLRLSIVKDIRERKRYEEEIQKLNKTLENK